MKDLFGFQDLTDIVENGVEVPRDNAPDAQKAGFKELKKYDCKALVILHQCVDDSHFEKIAGATIAKKAWDTLNKAILKLGLGLQVLVCYIYVGILL